MRDYEKWDRSNSMSLMIINHDIPKVLRDTISKEITSTNNFLTEIEKHFEKGW